MQQTETDKQAKRPMTSRSAGLKKYLTQSIENNQ